MSAFNWVEFETICPSCKSKSVIRAQTHTCADFDGDETGRFHDRTYKIGEKMAWWEVSDSRHANWTDSGGNLNLHSGELCECCYSNCLNCGADLFAPDSIVKVGFEINWPEGYMK